MQNSIFGEKVNYETIPPEFILVGLLKRFDNRYYGMADEKFKQTGWMRLYFLNGITLFKSPPSIQEMADFMGCSHQNANKLYSKLLKDGFILSKQDEKDRRKQRLELTEKGRQLLSDNNFGEGKSVLDIFSVLSPEEIDTAVKIIYKLTSHMENMQL